MIKKINAKSHGRNSGVVADGRVHQPDGGDKVPEDIILKHAQSMDKSSGAAVLNIPEKKPS